MTCCSALDASVRGGVGHANPLGDRLQTMSDVHASVSAKVAAVFGDAFGDRAKRLDGSVLATAAMDAITAALVDDHGVDKANDIALHMADWNSDAAFIVALHLFPERFTREEIDAGLSMFLCHAPNHIRAACGLIGQYVWETWPDTDG